MAVSAQNRRTKTKSTNSYIGCRLISWLNLIRDARKRANITLDELAAEVGLSAGQLRRIEFGTRSASLAELETIAAKLGISLAELLSCRADRNIPDKGSG